jgi:hypothetical protein
MRSLIRVGVAVVVCGTLLISCTLTKSRGESPKLANAYGDLAIYWQQITTSLGITPEEGLLQEWRLSYDEQGSVRALRLVIYVDRGSGKYEVYTINQNGTGTGTWNRSRLNNLAPIIAVPAKQFFTGLNSVGYRQLETHQAISPPIRSWFHTISGTITYGAEMRTHMIKDGRLIPAGPEGVTMRGTHGTFQMTKDITPRASSSTHGSATGSASTAARPGDSPPLYLMPEVSCFPESSTGSEVSRVWLCPGYR